jgi:hypothetical protein
VIDRCSRIVDNLQPLDKLTPGTMLPGCIDNFLPGATMPVFLNDQLNDPIRLGAQRLEDGVDTPEQIFTETDAVLVARSTAFSAWAHLMPAGRIVPSSALLFLARSA